VLQYRGVFKPVLSEFILHHVREGDVCVDLGANVGYFTLLLARAAGRGGKVVAIEAAPRNVRRLRGEPRYQRGLRARAGRTPAQAHTAR
jgi:predicted RNA methylase